MWKIKYYLLLRKNYPQNLMGSLGFHLSLKNFKNKSYEFK